MLGSILHSKISKQGQFQQCRKFFFISFFFFFPDRINRISLFSSIFALLYSRFFGKFSQQKIYLWFRADLFHHQQGFDMEIQSDFGEADCPYTPLSLHFSSDSEIFDRLSDSSELSNNSNGIDSDIREHLDIADGFMSEYAEVEATIHDNTVRRLETPAPSSHNAAPTSSFLCLQVIIFSFLFPSCNHNLFFFLILFFLSTQFISLLRLSIRKNINMFDSRFLVDLSFIFLDLFPCLFISEEFF